MIRRNPVSVKIKAPSRGLVSRWPSETSDMFSGNPADAQRTWAIAQNVRFEDGCVKNAPGYSRVRLLTTLLNSVVSHWRMEEASGTRFDSFNHNDLADTILATHPLHPGVLISSTTGKIGMAANLLTSSAGQVKGWNNNLVSTDLTSTLTGGDWTLCGWINTTDISAGKNTRFFNVANFSLSQSTANLTFGNGTVSTVAGLPANTWAFFVASYTAGTQTLSLSLNNGAAVTAVLAIDATTTFAGKLWIGQILGANRVSFAADSFTLFNRLLSGAEITTIYNAGTGLDFPFILGSAGTLLYEANLIVSNVASRPLVYGAGAQLFNITRSFISNIAGVPVTPQYEATLAQIFSGTAASTGYLWRAADFFDKVIFAQHDNGPQAWIGGAASTHALPGLTINSASPFSGSDDGNSRYDGCESFFGHLLLWHNDTLIWSDLNDFGNFIPVGITSVSATLATDGAHAFTQPAIGGTVAVTVTNPTGTNPVLAGGQFVRMIYTNGGVSFYNYYQVQSAPLPTVTTFTLRFLGTTGASAPATDFTNGAAASQTITTLDANEAGTSRIVGANVNGPILQVVALTDYAYLFKEWSIQSLQYVGQAQGTFFLRTEVTREGLLGRNALVNLGNGNIIFLGHRELYSYTGGPAPTPVCRQFTRQLLAEVDRTQLDQIVLFHREIRNEVWIVYPVQGGQKVLIWNYVEDSATLDVYDSILMGLKAGARVGWDVDPSWSSGSPTQFWSTIPDNESWVFFSGTGHQELMLLATGDFGLLVHGTGYSRDGVAYTSLGETKDFDFGDNTVFKYIDVIHVGLQITANDNGVRNLYMQVGTRPTLDKDITWSTAKALQVQGNANFTAKVNPGSGAGRYIRLRFYSQDANVNWQVSSYEIYGRAGGTY